jgi:hypothetical protein
MPKSTRRVFQRWDMSSEASSELLLLVESPLYRERRRGSEILGDRLERLLRRLLRPRRYVGELEGRGFLTCLRTTLLGKPGVGQTQTQIRKPLGCLRPRMTYVNSQSPERDPLAPALLPLLCTCICS